MKLLSIRPARAKGYLRLVISGIEDFIGDIDFTVSEAEYNNAGSPLVGDELTVKQYKLLADSNDRYHAKKSALSILSYGDNSKSRLVRKLREKGIGSHIADEVAREMVSLGYLNEARQIARLIQNEANISLRGPRLIISRLCAKGYQRAEVIRIMGELKDSGEVDFSEVKARLISRRLPEDATEEEIKKLLYKNGF